MNRSLAWVITNRWRLQSIQFKNDTVLLGQFFCSLCHACEHHAREIYTSGTLL